MSSLNNIAWKKFKKDPLGYFGLLIILFSIFISLFVYFLVPDKSSYANQMHLELSTKPPGFNVLILKFPDIQKQNISFFEKMFFGNHNSLQEIPILSINEKEKKYIKYSDSSEKKYSSLNNENYILENRTYYLGTDKYGRDLLSRLLIGTRVSISVGFISVFISLIIGVSLGSLAGYYKGKIDDFIMWLVNVIWSIPTLLLVIAITLALGKGFWQVFIAVGLTMWVEIARIVRGQVLSTREEEYIQAGKVLGLNSFRIIFNHILPNVLSAIIVISAANFASAILIEAGLSFLGLGVQPPVPSWGSMIKDHYAYIIMNKAYLAIIPGIAIVTLVLSFILVGNAVRDAFDVRT